jgi:uncharacterized protein
MTYTIIFIASILAGFVNTLTGSGSLVMLPALMDLGGLNATIANGTNRVAIFFQSIVGVKTYLSQKKVEIGTAWWTIIPCCIGALLGACIATLIDAEWMKQFIGYLFIVMLFVILVNPKRWLKAEPNPQTKEKKILSIAMMFLIGVYGGFIQGGFGNFLLIGLVLGVGYTLNYANGLKLIVVALYAPFVLFIFVWQNQIDWYMGLFTAVGQSLGAYLGARFATQYKQADLWTYRLLILIVLASIISFFKPYFW